MRTKKVFSNYNQVIIAWLNNKDENRDGRSAGKGRVFFKGNTIYSYGTHFPMAIKLGNNKFKFNSDKYSSSTSKTQNKLHRHIVYFNGEIEYIKLSNYDTRT